jgi:hypothetical protein
MAMMSLRVGATVIFESDCTRRISMLWTEISECPVEARTEKKCVRRIQSGEHAGEQFVIWPSRMRE